MADGLTVAQPIPAVRSAAAQILPLTLEGVSYAVQGRRLIDDISLRIDAGPKTLILGPNGAGKSLLLRLCHGLIRPTSGTVRWACPAGTALARAQAMSFQNPVLLRRSALANIEYALATRGVPKAERRGRAEEALAEAGLASKAKTPAPVMSGGERQRLALARAWALKPQILFLDEPTANLDPAAAHAVEQLIATIDAAGTKIVMTTHDLGQARRLADEIIFIHHGKVAERNVAHAFFDGPANDAARAFLEGRLLW
jgi:tungstate transport system ATP-binding protein